MKSKLAVMVALACASSQVVAVEPQSIQTSSGFDITPFLTTGLKYDDNVASTSANEIDSWIIDQLKAIGCDTARSVLELDKDELIRRADLEEETINEVLRILRSEFED